MSWLAHGLAFVTLEGKLDVLFSSSLRWTLAVGKVLVITSNSVANVLEVGTA